MISKQLTPWSKIASKSVIETEDYRIGILHTTRNVLGALIAYVSIRRRKSNRDINEKVIVMTIWDEEATISKQEFASADDAMSYCNEELKELGYEFISDERAEKIRLLL